MPFQKKHLDEDPEFVEPTSKKKAESYENRRASLKKTVIEPKKTRSTASLEVAEVVGMYICLYWNENHDGCHNLEYENVCFEEDIEQSSEEKQPPIIKRRKRNRVNRKAGTHTRGLEDNKRQSEWMKEYDFVCENLANIGDPFNNMCLEDKKVHGISQFYQLMKVLFLYTLIFLPHSVPAKTKFLTK